MIFKDSTAANEDNEQATVIDKEMSHELRAELKRLGAKLTSRRPPRAQR